MAKDILDKNIAIIGAGHMGSALVKGLVNAGVSHACITVSDRAKDNVRAARKADWIFIAVKPSVVVSVLEDIKAEARGKIIISLAAGVSLADMRKRARGAHIVRIMPNLPIAENMGVIGFFASGISARDRAALRGLLQRLGLLIEVKKESDLDAVTLVAGCGPGIVAALVEMVAKRARALGLRETDTIALQTFMGAIHHMVRAGVSASDLMKSVATKGGVTEAILKELQRGGLEKNFAKAIESGRKKLKSIRA